MSPIVSSPQSAQSVQTQGVQSIIASNATFTSGGVTLSGLGAATVQTAAAQRVDINVPVQSVQVVQSALAASNTTYTSGLVTITGVGGGVTVSSNTGQRIDISVAAPVAQSVQTQNMVAVSASNTLYSSGTVVFTGSNMITVKSSGAGQTIIIDATQSVQVVQSAIAASNTTYTSGLVTITGVGGGVTVSSNTGQRIDISVAAPVAQSVQTQNVVDVTLSGNTSGALALVSSGTLTLAGGNNITLSQAGNAITISGAAAGGAQTAISGVAASNTTYTSGTITISGVGGGITVSSNTGQRVDLSVAAQSVQVVQSALAASNTTYTSGLVVITGSNMITVKSSGAGQTIILDATQSVQVVQSAIAASNTTYTSGAVSFTGVGGGVTVQSNTGQRVDISVATPVNFSAGVSTGGNTAGATGASGTQLVLVGTNGITLSQTTGANGLTISISGGAGGGGGVNIAASNTTYTSGTVVFSASDSYRSAISIASVGAQSVIVSDAGPQLADWERGRIIGIDANSLTIHTNMIVFPLIAEGANRFPGRMTASIARFAVSYSQTASASVSGILSSTMNVFVYTRNSDSLSLLNSGSMSFGNTVATSNNSVHWNNLLALDITATSAWSVRPDFLYGGEYYIGVQLLSHLSQGSGGPFLAMINTTASSLQDFRSFDPATTAPPSARPVPFLGQVTLTASNHIRTTIVNSMVSVSQAGNRYLFQPYFALYQSTQHAGTA